MSPTKRSRPSRGFAQGDKLHPVQDAFLAEAAFQCAYCTSGMIMGTVALLAETPHPTDEQIVGEGLTATFAAAGAIRRFSPRFGGRRKGEMKTVSAKLKHETKRQTRNTKPGPRGGSSCRFLGAGLLIAVLDGKTFARRGVAVGAEARGGANGPLSTRLHTGKDGTITVMVVGKVEAGQGARAELTQVAAEELRVPADGITLIMADTAQVPDDGMTAGSGTTPKRCPRCGRRQRPRGDAHRCGSGRWNLTADKVEMRDGKVIDAARKRELSYAGPGDGG